MGIRILMWICNTKNPDPTVKTSARVATHKSHLINRTSSLTNAGYGNPSISETASQMFHNGEDLD